MSQRPQGPTTELSPAAHPLRRFLRSLLVCVAGLSVLLILVLSALFAKLQPDFDAYFTLPEETRVLFVGDSHVGCSLEEQQPTHGKLWRSSTSPMSSLLRLRRVEQLGWPKNLKTIVTEFGTQTVVAEHYAVRDWIPARRRESLLWAWRDPLAWNYGGRYLLRGMPQLFSLLTDYEMREYPPSTDTPFSELPAEKIEEALNYSFISHYPSSLSEGDYLHCWAETQAELLALKGYCDQRGLRLILISTPTSSRYRARIPQLWQKRFAEQQAWLRAQGFEYYDYRAAFDDFWFRDSHHLRPSGTKKFTAFFLKEHGLE